MLSLVHLIYMAGDKCMRQNACFNNKINIKASLSTTMPTNDYLTPAYLVNLNALLFSFMSIKVFLWLQTSQNTIFCCSLHEQSLSY